MYMGATTAAVNEEIKQASNIDRSYVYQIFSNDKKPSRDKLIAI